MGRSGGLALRGRLDDLFDPVGVVGHRSAPSGRDLGEAVGAALPEAVTVGRLTPTSLAIPPEDHGGAAHAHLPSDPGVG